MQTITNISQEILEAFASSEVITTPITLTAIVIGAIFVNNVVLSQFLGICPFLGVSSKVPLISSSCALQGFGLLMVQKEFSLLTGVVFSVATALGFALALVLFAGIRERLEVEDVPAGLRGVPIALITASLLAMAFMGFANVVPLP